MFRALILRTRIRHGLPGLGLAVVLGLVAIPVAHLPLPVSEGWDTYVHTVCFFLAPIPAATVFAFLAQRCAATIEHVNGPRTRVLLAGQTLIGLVLAYPAVLLPSLPRPVPHAAMVGAMEFGVVAACTAASSLGVEWYYAWLPAIPIALGAGMSGRLQHVLLALSTLPHHLSILVLAGIVLVTVLLVALPPIRSRDLSAG